MASDQAYTDFLNKANEDPTANPAHSATANQPPISQSAFKAQDASAIIPASITAAIKDAVYTSDADEPFIPVALEWHDERSNGLPDEGELPPAPAMF